MNYDMMVFMTNKEINRAIEEILDIPRLYDVRCGMTLVRGSLPLDEAEELRYNMSMEYSEQPEEFYIVSSRSEPYTEDLNLALEAAKNIAEKHHLTFVLSLERGTWVASYGDYGDCTQYKGSNPAYATCVSILQYMGKL